MVNVTFHKQSKPFFLLYKNKKASKVLIVGHGANLTASVRTLLGYNEALLRKEGGLANASITILETDDFNNFHLKVWNDISYQKHN